MAKITKDVPGALFPTPVVLVTTVDIDSRPNIITLAWVGIVCSNPYMLSLAIRPGRHSHALLETLPELVVNVPDKALVGQTDRCGTISGRDVDKFAETGLTAVPAQLVGPPLIEECPVNMECRVKERLSLGTHDVFIAEVVKTHIDEALLDEAGKFDSARIQAFTYLGLDYWSLARKIGRYGYTKQD